MKTLIISGSRNAEGQTARAADAVLEGAIKAGAEVERIFLPELAIERCRQCENTGWGKCKSESRCVILDDHVSIFEKIVEANGVIFATPVYFGDLSESMRSFIDRMRRLCTRGGRGEEIKGKPVIGLCVAGNSGRGATECCAIMDKMLSRSGFFLADMFPVRRQNLEAKLSGLRLAGEWLAGLEPYDEAPFRLPPPGKL